MNLEFIRAVDKWAGIPACFVLTLAYRIFPWFRSLLRREAESGSADRNFEEIPRRILFIELSEMGSVVLAYPAMKWVQRTYSEAELYFLVFEQNRSCVDVLRTIPPDHVFTISMQSPLHFFWSTCRAVKMIRAAGMDTVFDLELFSRFSALLSGLSGAQRRVGYGTYHEEGLYRGGFLTHRVFYNCHQHMAKNFLALAKAIERQGEYPLVKAVIADEEPARPRYASSEKDLNALRERLAAINPAVRDAEHLVLLNPSAGRLLPIRAWPVERYTALAERILKVFDAVIILIGLEDAKCEAYRILESVGVGRCIDFTGRSSFKDLFDLFHLADVLVSADSGPPHFASLTNINTITLFGPETPNLYAPLGPNAACLFAGLSCSPCLSAYNHRKTTCRDARCMKAITVEQVFDAVSEYLCGTKGC
jgi:ADP-heptose:LPS heptosyltransferase